MVEEVRQEVSEHLLQAGSVPDHDHVAVVFERDVSRRVDGDLHRLPVDDRADRADHVRDARQGIPLAVVAHQGDPAEPAFARRGAGGVVLWQWGWDTEAILGIQPDGAVGTFIPVTIFAFLYGLSMDYEVFILARMREEYDRTGATREAIVSGIGRTGRLVTCAALILFFSFSSMAFGGELDVAIFASGIGLGIILDATLIRSVLVPATVSMMGKWNWWLPRPVARLLRVEPSPLREERSMPAEEQATARVGV